ncbi:MAG TPA: terminase small subunit [Stellaceae bacterium]|nr:terminase small subunit [Stellaceae bacterium]
MTPLQLNFIREYLVDLNGTRAAIRAGYSPKSASRVASEMLRSRPQIMKALNDALAAREFRAFLSKDRLLLEYAHIAFSDIRELLDWGPDGVTLKSSSTVSDAGAAAISEISGGKGGAAGRSRLRLHDKKKALDALMRLLELKDKSGEGAPRAEGHLSPRELLFQRLEALAKAEKETG